MLQSLLAALTETQTDEALRLVGEMIGIVGKIVAGIASLVGIVLPVLLLHFQRKNKAEVTSRIEAVDAKVVANTEISEKAFTVANGHNEKIANLTQQVADAVQHTKGQP